MKKYDEGYAAFKAGRPQDSNPYEPDTIPFYEWRDGWIVARVDSICKDD